MKVEQDLASVLQLLLDRARTALYADSVVVLTREFQAVPALIVSRERHDSANEQLQTVLREGGLAHPVYETGSVYLQSESEYREFISKQGVKKDPVLAEQDFWSRENLESLACVRLGEERDPHGVMLSITERGRALIPQRKNLSKLLHL